VRHDMGRTLSPLGAPSAARLRMMIRDEVMNYLRSEHGREESGRQEGGMLQGRPGARGRVVRRTESGRRGEEREPPSSSTAHVDRGPAERLVPVIM
ncbi:hypothetical protein EV122DRAFT_185492, partial [Schizophyllum commune]